MEIIRAFLSGGLICMIVQLLMDHTKLMPGRIMVLLVMTGAVSGAIGVYEPFLQWGGQGAALPLTGFGNTLYQGVREAVRTKGWIGLFEGSLSASAAGISAALIFGYLSSLIFRSDKIE